MTKVTLENAAMFTLSLDKNLYIANSSITSEK